MSFLTLRVGKDGFKKSPAAREEFTCGWSSELTRWWRSPTQDTRQPFGVRERSVDGHEPAAGLLLSGFSQSVWATQTPTASPPPHLVSISIHVSKTQLTIMYPLGFLHICL